MKNLSKKHYYVVAFFLLAVMFAESLFAMTSYSITADETTHIGSSYYYWKAYLKGGNVTLQMDNPPLTRIISGFPLLILDLNYPEGNWKDGTYNNSYRFGEHLLYKIGNDTEAILFFSRLPIIILSLILGYSIFLFASKIYDYRAGIFALFLYVFEPTIIGHNSLFTTDMAVTAFMLFTIFALWRFVVNPDYKNAVIVGVFFVLSLMTKLTALFLVPIIFLLLVIFTYKKLLKSRQALALIIILIVLSLVLINSFYLFRGFGKALTDNIGKDRIERRIADNPLKPIILAVVDVPMPLPESYILGLSDQILHQLSGYPAFLLGEYSRLGWWYYFPAAFVLKISVFLLIFISFSMFIFYKKGFEKGNARIAEYMAIAFITIFFAINLFSHIDLGVRILLPVFPFIILLCSKPVKYIRHHHVYVILALLYVASSLLASPNYISFFNEVIGSENGYMYLSGSNIDWGQDVKNAFLWLREHGINEISYRVQGSSSVPYYAGKYNITATELKTCTPAQGYIVISSDMYIDVHNLDGNHSCFNWVKKHELITRIGHSIFVFKV